MTYPPRGRARARLSQSDLSSLFHSAYPDAKRLSQAEFAILCPAHDDAEPSLRVNVAKSTCYCDPCAAHGTQYPRHIIQLPNVKPLLPDSRDAARSVSGPEYVYHDENGAPLLRIKRGTRNGERTFIASRFEDGGWKPGAKGVRRVLYQLPEVLAADSVVIVEGEKDCDTLRSLGIVATTNPFGAGKWSETYTESLIGKRVVLIPDNDEPGRKHMHAVAASLQGKSHIRWLALPDLPEKGDASDFVEQSPDNALRLLELIAKAPAYRPERIAEVQSEARSRLVVASSIPEEEISWLWHPYIPIGGLTLLEGDGGLGKSTLALELCAKVSRGRLLPKQGSSTPRNVVYMTAEDIPGNTIVPRLRRSGADLDHVFILEASDKDEDGRLRTFTLKDIQKLEGYMREVSPALIVVDPLQGFLGSDVDMHRANEVRPVLHQVKCLAAEYHCAVVIIRHLRKSSAERASQRGMGSMDFYAAARSVLLVAPNPLDEDQRILAPVKSNLARLGSSLAFTIADDGFHWLGDSELSAEDLNAKPSRKQWTEEGISPRDEASRFLQERLADGAVSARDLKDEVEHSGNVLCSWRTVESIKSDVGVQVTKQKDGWYWSLPERDRYRPTQPRANPFLGIGAKRDTKCEKDGQDRHAP